MNSLLQQSEMLSNKEIFAQQIAFFREKGLLPKE
jgi:hypothetical protein